MADSSVEDSESTTLEPHLTSPNVIDPYPSKISNNNVNVKVI